MLESISSTEMHGTVSLAELNWFYTHTQVFHMASQQVTYSHMLDEIIHWYKPIT